MPFLAAAAPALGAAGSAAGIAKTASDALSQKPTPFQGPSPVDYVNAGGQLAGGVAKLVQPPPPVRPQYGISSGASPSGFGSLPGLQPVAAQQFSQGFNQNTGLDALLRLLQGGQ